MSITVQFKQTTVTPTYVSGNFENGELLGSSYPISMYETGVTGTSWAWSIVTAPRGSTAAISSSTSQTATFVPDMTGTWLIKCSINAGDETVQHYMTVLPYNKNGRMPACKEDKEDATYGWSEGQNDMMRSLDEGEQRVYAAEAIDALKIACYSASSGTVQQPRVMLMSSCISTSWLSYRRPLGIAIDAISSGQYGILKTKGLVPFDTTTISGAAYGATVFADVTTDKLTMDTTEYPVGIIMRLGVAPGASGTIGAIYFDFSGLALTLEETFIPIEWCEDGSTPPAMSEVLTDGNGSVRIRKFDGTTEEDVIFPWEIPSSFIPIEGMLISVIGYISESTTPSSEGVSFEFSRYSIDDNGALDGTFSGSTNSNKTSMTYSQYDRFVTDEEIMNTIYDQCYPSRTLMIKVARDVDDTCDTYEEDVGVYGFRLRWVARK